MDTLWWLLVEALLCSLAFVAPMANSLSFDTTVEPVHSTAHAFVTTVDDSCTSSASCAAQEPDLCANDNSCDCIDGLCVHRQSTAPFITTTSSSSSTTSTTSIELPVEVTTVGSAILNCTNDTSCNVVAPDLCNDDCECLSGECIVVRL